jgi:hypothetical protein
MAKFLIGVDIEQIRSTVIIVEVDAETREEAERKAVCGAEAACRKAGMSSNLGIGNFHEWDGDCFSCLGVNSEEDWNSGDYSSDLKV